VRISHELPEAPHPVGVEDCIHANKRDILDQCLRNEEAIEGVTVVNYPRAQARGLQLRR
jgi:hypothetical protein